MAIVYRTNGDWGSGKGSPLTAAEVDENFYDLDQRVEDLETNGVQPNNIASIQVIGSQMTIFMEDYSTFGPFTLPIALFHWRDIWQTETDYNELDLFYVIGQGLYMVRLDHTSDVYEFDENAMNEESEPLYTKLFGIPGFQTWYDIPIFIPGMPGNGALVYKHIAPREWYLDEDESECPISAGTLPTADPAEFDIRKNDVSIGALEIYPGGAYFMNLDSSPVQFAKDDVLDIYAPSPQDATLADVSIVIDGLRENVGG